MVSEARQCTAFCRDGSRCSVRALPSSAEQRCFTHDTARQATLRESRRAGGHGRSTAARVLKNLPPEIVILVETLQRILADVESGTVPPGVGQACGSLCGRILDAYRFGYEVTEGLEVARRLEALEEAAKA